MKSYSPVGLVNRQWDAVDWACVPCDRRIHNDWASRSANLQQCACAFYSSRAGFFFGKTSHHSDLSAYCHLQPRFGSLQFLAFPKAKIAIERGEICECDGHTTHKSSQLSLTAGWLATWKSDCSQMCNKVSTDWLPSYIMAMQLVLKIFKMAEYFLDRPHMYLGS